MATQRTLSVYVSSYTKYVERNKMVDWDNNKLDGKGGNVEMNLEEIRFVDVNYSHSGSMTGFVEDCNECSCPIKIGEFFR
jgi:hypothetical protein